MMVAHTDIEKPWALILAERQGVLLRVSDDGRIGFSSYGNAPAPVLRQRLIEAQDDIASWYARQREIEAQMWRQARNIAGLLSLVEIEQATAHAEQLAALDPVDLQAYRQRKLQQLMEVHDEQEACADIDDIDDFPQVTSVTAQEIYALDLVDAGGTRGHG